MIPTRLWLDRALPHEREKVLRLAHFLMQGDPLADALVLEKQAFDKMLKSLEPMPFWVDRERLKRGGRVFLDTGFIGAVVLGMRSLLVSYCSPAGNKPLVMTGRLERDVSKRLLSTGRFVWAVSDNLWCGGEALQAIAGVRLVHAKVRKQVLASGQWNNESWGLPINQADMAGTVLLFSQVLIEGLRRMGVSLSEEQRDDMMHLWKYAGFLMGVDQELLVSSYDEGTAFWDLLERTQGCGDEDGRRLATALIDAFATPQTAGAKPDPKARRVARQLAVHLTGPMYAEALGLPRQVPLLIPSIRAAIGGVHRALNIAPGVKSKIGDSYWKGILAAGKALNKVSQVAE